MTVCSFCLRPSLDGLQRENQRLGRELRAANAEIERHRRETAALARRRADARRAQKLAADPQSNLFTGELAEPPHPAAESRGTASPPDACVPAPAGGLGAKGEERR